MDRYKCVSCGRSHHHSATNAPPYYCKRCAKLPLRKRRHHVTSYLRKGFLHRQIALAD